MTRSSFAERLNRLFDSVYPPGRRPYSSAEVVAGVRAFGATMSAPYLSQLRSGNRDNPSSATTEALAKFFGIAPAYFADDEYADQLDEELSALAELREQRAASPVNHSARIEASNVEQRAAGPEAASSVASSGSAGLEGVAERLNILFDTVLKPSGVPYSSEEVASTLQEDGLPVAASVIRQLRAGTAELPDRKILDALAYFFNASPDSFIGKATAVPRGGPQLAEEAAASRVRFDDLARCVFGLAKSSIRCFEAHPPDLDQARKLMALAARLSTLATRCDGEFIDIPVDLRSALTETWTSIDAEVILDQLFHTRRDPGGVSKT